MMDVLHLPLDVGNKVFFYLNLPCAVMHHEKNSQRTYDRPRDVLLA
jgi:hypothetical protein